MTPSAAPAGPSSAPARPLPRPLPRPRRLALSALLGAALALAGCGGGVYLTVPIGGGYDDPPPAVALSPLPSFVQPRGQLVLGAAVSSVYAVEDVAFYLYDGRTATFLGADPVPPYQWPTVVPTDGRPSVSYFAQVRDVAGRVAESRVVTAPIVY